MTEWEAYMVAGEGTIRTKPDAVLIAGPTASGKSRLAIAVAERVRGVVINADSMQVYRDLRVLTARPETADEADIPHRLYGHVDAAERYSVGRWLIDARATLARAAAEGTTPVFVGGTGLYFRALTEGLSAVPPIPEAVRSNVAELAAGLDSAALHDRLADSAPEDAARLRPSDRSRVMRALEVVEATGQSLVWWHREHPPEPLIAVANLGRVILMPDRETLVERIGERVRVMLSAGAIYEVAALLDRGLPTSLPALKAIGVRQLADHLEGRSSLEEAAAAMIVETRRYAKRQATWFRHQTAGWPVAVDHHAALDVLHDDE